MSRRKIEYKPLSFTTTLRNPMRMKDFINILMKYNGEILSNDLINKVVEDIILNKLYKPTYIGSNPHLNRIFHSDDNFTHDQLRMIIDNSPQNHKEAGFNHGWPSRFDTWYKFLKELGLIYYEIDKKIEISELGVKLSTSLKEGYEHLENQVFANSFARYHRNNPFRRVKNRNKPLILLLKTILELRNRYPNSKGISRKELCILLCWKDDNHIELVNEISNIRKIYGYNPSDDIIYEKCKEILNLTDKDERRFKKDNILLEKTDDFIRKMRLTGFISLRGMGRFIDINSLEKSKIDYILLEYSDLVDFSSEIDYYKYMKEIDYNLVSKEVFIISNIEEKENHLIKWTEEFTLDELIEELQIVGNSRRFSRNPVFKYIDEPLRLEFLTALVLQKKFSDVIVRPNYIVDDEGLPSAYAPGGNGDIECIDNQGSILFEVTLVTGTQQNIREMNSIWRHLLQCAEKSAEAFTVMIAPSIHEDTERYKDYIKYKDNLDITTVNIEEFIYNLNTISNIREFRRL